MGPEINSADILWTYVSIWWAFAGCVHRLRELYLCIISKDGEEIGGVSEILLNHVGLQHDINCMSLAGVVFFTVASMGLCFGFALTTVTIK